MWWRQTEGGKMRNCSTTSTSHVPIDDVDRRRFKCLFNDVCSFAERRNHQLLNEFHNRHINGSANRERDGKRFSIDYLRWKKKNRTTSKNCFVFNKYHWALEWPKIWIITLGILLILLDLIILGVEIGHTVADVYRSTAFGGIILFLPLLASAIFVLITGE